LTKLNSIQTGLDQDDAISFLRDAVSHLTLEMTVIRTQLSQLLKSKTFVVSLSTLEPEPFRIVQSIPVVLEGDGNEFTASFIEGNISASGETEADAILNFKESLISNYEILEGMPADKLGPLPSRQWAILKSVLKRA
jgi:hypothetical protein